jgi:pimeloyl-ACP methyl ester carboxylesterase
MDVRLAAGHSFRAVAGVRLHWAELGEDRRRTPVVLLHGLNDSHLTWKRVAPALAIDRRVLMPDLPGYGLSERPNASYELGWHAKVIARWLEALQLEKVDLVGHSFGGGVAQVMLLECPARIRRLALVASGGLGREVSLVLRLASLPGVVEYLGQSFMALGTRMTLRGHHAGFLPQEVAELCAMNAISGSARAFARTVRDVVDWRGQRRTFFQRANELADLPPIAVFWGSRDKMIPAAHGKAFAESVSGVALTLFEDCGHYPHYERPADFARALQAFLDG